MKVVFTLFQCKRVALPYVWIRYGFPAMQRLLAADSRVFLIQHQPEHQAQPMATATASLPDSKLELVRQWTRDGRYDGATIVSHAEPSHPKHHTLQPSYRIGMEIALRENADLHIWLEDDAFIYDDACAQWSNLMQGNEVGVFRPYTRHVHCAFLISSPSFDERLLPLFSRPELDDIQLDLPTTGGWTPSPGHIEYYTTWASLQRRAALPAKAAARIHPSDDPAALLQLLHRVVPDDERPLLSLDFPDIC